MPLNFPDAPAADDEFTDPISGATWLYDGAKWGSAAGGSAKYVLKAGDTMTGPLVLPAAAPVADEEAANKAYVDTHLLTTGGTLTGDLEINNAGVTSTLVLDKSPGGSNYLAGTQDGVNRWGIVLGNSTAETGGFVGSDFSIVPYDNAGNFSNPALMIDRSGWISISSGFAITGGNTFDASGSLAVAYRGYQPGGNLWYDLSDARIKTVLGDYGHGLAELKQINPVRYRFKGNDTLASRKEDEAAVSPHGMVLDEEFIGVVAQDVESVMPEMVTQTTGYIDGQEVSDLRVLNASALIYALVNSVKELSARLEALEGGAPARDVTVNTVNVQPRSPPSRNGRKK